MIFKVEVLSEEVHCIRGYQKENDNNYIFCCTLHRPDGEKQWQIKATLSIGGTLKEVMEAFNFLKNYPSGVYTYVTKEDFERFYKRFCQKIKFDDCNF